MKRKEIVTSVYNFIEPELNRNGFEFEAKTDYFVNRNESRICIFDLHFYNRSNLTNGERGFSVEPYIWINFSEIEYYYKEITLNKELKKDTDFKVLGGRIAELKSNPDGIHKIWNQSFEFLIFKEEDIPGVANVILNEFRSSALPYFKKNSTIKMIDRLANEFPEKQTVHITNDNLRFIYGLLAAKLNNNPNIDSLVSRYQKIVADYRLEDDAVAEFESLITMLPYINNKHKI